jgi:hypothetical protein
MGELINYKVWQKLRSFGLFWYYTHARARSLSLSLSLYIYIYIYISPIVTTLDHRSSLKCIVSLQFLNPKKVGRTPWLGDQSVARPLPIQTWTNIHALSGIRTHDPGVQVGKDSSCLRPHSHCDRLSDITNSSDIHLNTDINQGADCA